MSRWRQAYLLLGGLPVVLAVLLGLAASAPGPKPGLVPAPQQSGTPPQLRWSGPDGARAEAITADGEDAWVSVAGDGSGAVPVPSGRPFAAALSAAAAERRACVPTALRWSHPKPGLPWADVVVAAAMRSDGRPGASTMLTRPRADHGGLPVVSLVAADDDLFSGPRGLMVPGETMLEAPAALASAYARDPVFWKYPGNYHQRGKAWERRALVQLLGVNGEPRWTAPAAIRINGQQTRGLAQHALRAVFDEPLADTVFGAGSSGLAAIIIRAAGNDQIKAMMRDAYQHRLCASLPFDTSPALSCVLYINGAYWGVHHLRPRLDHEEIARRIGARPKDITIVEDRGVTYRGRPEGAQELLRLIRAAEAAGASDSAALEALERELDVEEFLTYMAAQMILGNMDWPHQNIRFWRHERPGKGRSDGRWRMAMGDSDLGFGALAPPSDDLFRRVAPKDTPAARLLMAVLRWPGMRERFDRTVLRLLDGPLGSRACLEELDRLVALLEPEMERHTARWRKPADRAAWKQEVEVVRRYAMERERHVRGQLGQRLNQSPR